MEKDIILDSIADGVFTVDDNWRITSFNRAAEEITGVRREEAVGQRCKDVLKADVCERGCILRKTIQSGKSIVNRTVHIVDAAGRRLPISISTALLKDEQGRIVGAVETFRDISVEEKLRKTIAERKSPDYPVRPWPVLFPMITGAMSGNFRILSSTPLSFVNRD